jgi:nucleoside-diphosphate-sugar epimerase
VKLQYLDFIRQDCLRSLSSRENTLTSLKNQSIVITGAGFTGTWLTEFLTMLNDEYSFGTEIILISDDTESFRSSRPHLASRADVSLIKKDVRDVSEIPRQTSWVIHTAANPNARYHSSLPFETMRVIAEGTAAVLKTVERVDDFRMFMNVSSALVHESLHSGSASSAYAEAKRYGETLSAAAVSQLRIPCINVRPFSFLGPYQSLETPSVINGFIGDGLRGNPIRILEDERTTANYMYASDMAFWYLRILTAGESGASYDVGSPIGVSLKDLAGHVAANFTPSPEIRLNTYPNTSHRAHVIPDTSEVTKKMGLDLKFDIETSIQRTVLWNRSR